MKINLIYVKAESRSNMFKHSKASEYLDFQVKNKNVLKMLTYIKDGLTVANKRMIKDVQEDFSNN